MTFFFFFFPQMTVPPTITLQGVFDLLSEDKKYQLKTPGATGKNGPIYVRSPKMLEQVKNFRVAFGLFFISQAFFSRLSARILKLLCASSSSPAMSSTLPTLSWERRACL